MSKKGYPLHEDIIRAIKFVIAKGTYKPFELYKEVSTILDKWGYYTGHINVKRVWKLYLNITGQNYVKLKLK
jgi:hypothetical protein